MSNNEKIPVVFISYCWTTEEHKQWVLELATRLVKKSGVEVILDRWHGIVGHDRYHFMEDSIAKADKVLVVCDRKYCEKANNREGGVGTETLIITPDIYSNTKQEKFIPIALEKDSNGDFLLPSYFSSRFALGMINSGEFDSKYKELERLIWQEPLLKPPVRGSKPNFNLDETVKEEGILFNKEDEERVIWLLPRGFLFFTDITFQTSNSWACVVNYYDYNGDWKHGTHYHNSYFRSWDRNLNIQFGKLSIPEADWNWAYAPLNFLQELRDVTEAVNIEEMVENKRLYDHPVFYYKPSEEIMLPKIPLEFEFYNESGNIRDIIEEVRDKGKIERSSEEELLQYCMTIRHSTYLESLECFGETHPSFGFIKEVIDDFDKSFSRLNLINWLSKLEQILQNSLNHKWEKWYKEIKMSNQKI